MMQSEDSINNLSDPAKKTQEDPLALEEDLKDDIAEKPRTCREKTSFFCRHFKDAFFMIVLLAANMLNFSILSALYTLAGMILIFLLFRQSSSVQKTKMIFEMILLVYAILCLTFKILTICLHYYQVPLWTDFIEENKELLLNLGVMYLKKPDEFLELFNTVFGDSAVIFSSIFVLIITCVFAKDKTDSDFKQDLSGSELKTYLNYFIFAISLTILALTCFNCSFVSIFFSLAIHLGLLLWGLGYNKAALVYQKINNYLLMIVLFISMALTNIFNVHTLRKTYMVGSSDMRVIKWFGIKKMSLNYEYFGTYLLMVVATAICVITTKFFNRYASSDTVLNSKTFIENRYQSFVSVESDEVEHSNTCEKIKKILVRYIYSQFFILHFCRISVILWLLRFETYPSLGLILWILVSFLIFNTNSIKYLTLIVVLPCLFYSYYASTVTNIEDFIDLPSDKIFYSHLCLQKFDTPLVEFAVIQFAILIFAVFVRSNTATQVKKVKDKGELHQTLIEGECDNNNNNIAANKNKIDIEINFLQQDDKTIQAQAEADDSISFSDLIAKFLVTNIDKITVICMYFLAIGEVNIFHFVLMTIFMIQLILPQVIRYICIYLIMIIQLIFSLEYIWDLLKVHVEMSDDLIDLISFFFECSKDLTKTSKEIVLYLVIYCFYIQYHNYHSNLYKNVSDNSKYTFKAYIDEKLKNYERVKKWIDIIMYGCLEIYVWIILVLSFIFICLFEYYLLFSIKLLLFFIIVYLFLTLSTNPQKNKKILKFVWVFIIFCCVNTLLIYFYQFTVLNFVKKWYHDAIESELPQWWVDNLPIFGLQKYTSSLPYRFLSHYASNFLSVLIYWEIRRILNNKEDQMAKKDSLSSVGEDFLGFNAQVSKEKGKKLKTLPISMKKYYFFNIMILVTKTYWLFLFLAICALFTSHQLSLAMIIYIIIFSFTFIFMFKTLVNSVHRFLVEKSTFFISKLIRYVLVEKPTNIRILRKHRKKAFKYLLLFGLLYILLTYAYSLFDIFQHGCKSWNCGINNNPLVEKDIEETIEVLSYLGGVYNNVNQTSFFGAVWSHLLMIMLISLDIYIQKFQNYLTKEVIEMKKIIKINEKIEKMKGDNKMTALFKGKVSKGGEILHLGDKKDKPTVLDVMPSECPHSSSEHSLSNAGDSRSESMNFPDPGEVEPEKKENNLDKHSLGPGERTRQEIVDDYKDVPLMMKFFQIFLNYEESEKQNKNEKIQTQLNNKSTSLTFLTGLKQSFEEFLILLLLVTAISKLNIISILYLLIVLYLQLCGKNLRKIYFMTIIVIISIIAQSLMFLSNFNEYSDPRPNKDILLLIKAKLGIPWYKEELNDAWGFFSSLGVNSYQVQALWMDFVLIMFCFIYLDNFCYSIYEESVNKGSAKASGARINYYNLRQKNSLRKALLEIPEGDYEEYRENLKHNFTIDLLPYQELLQKFHLSKIHKKQTFRHMQSKIIEDQIQRTIQLEQTYYHKKKKSRMEQIMAGAKKTLYLSMHNLLLVVVLILSMMISGLISTIYIVFSLIFLYQSNKIILGRRTSFPNAIRTFLRIFILIDLLVQFSAQSPLNAKIKDALLYIVTAVGINPIVTFENPEDCRTFHINPQYIVLDNLKAVTYFFISIQVLIYSSNDFREFYITYVLKKNDNLKKSSLINAFLFNNRRIQMMKRTVEDRKMINRVMTQLEAQLEEWNGKLTSGIEKNESAGAVTQDEHNKPASETASLNLITSQEEETKIKEKIKKKIMEGFLIKASIHLHRHTTNYGYVEKENKSKLEMSIIKGQTYIESTIEEKIDEFLDELDIKDIQCDELLEYIDSTENDGGKSEDKDKTTENKKEIEIKPEEPHVHATKRLASPGKIDMKKYHQIVNAKLFQKYLTKGYLIKLITFNIFTFLLNNFEYVCYFAMILNHIMYGSMISLFWPILTFGFGLIQYPRPRRIFWNVALIYASVTLIVKFFIQFNFIAKIPSIQSFMKPFEKYKVGMIICTSTFDPAFFYYIIFDAILIFFLLFQESVLISRGLSENTEPEIESLDEAHLRIFKSSTIQVEDTEKFIEKFLGQSSKTKKEPEEDIIKEEEEEEEKPENREISTAKGEINEKSQPSFYQEIFPRIRNEKPGEDFYAFYTLAIMLLILYIIFFYARMDQDKTFGSTTTTTRQFSGTMVLFAFLHVFIVVCDRIVYIRQSRNHLAFEYYYYEKTTGAKLNAAEVEELMSHVKNAYPDLIQPNKVLQPEDIDKIESEFNVHVIYYQKEEVNWPLICKYILHMLSLIFSHLFIFFFLPFVGNLNFQSSYSCDDKSQGCNDFLQNPFLIIFYIIYLFYHFFSAIQIHYGLLDMKKKALLMRGENIVYSSLFKGFNAVPFLYELKLTIDWTFTPTCLDLFKWIKFESVYDCLFSTNCLMKRQAKTPIGTQISGFQKLLFGGVSFTVLLGIILGPLLLFSTLNPTNQFNNVTGAAIALSICFKQGVVFNNYTLFKNEYVESIIDLKDQPEIWDSYGYSQSPQTKNFAKNQVQIIRMSQTSDSIWDIPLPHIESIIDRLKNYNITGYKINFRFNYLFSRPNPIETKDSNKNFDVPLYNRETGIEKTEQITSLLSNIQNCTKKEILLQNFYLPSVRLSSSPHPKLINDPIFTPINVSLNFICEKNSNESAIDYSKSYFVFRKLDEARDPTKGIVFHTFSDKVSPTSTSYDLLTFYVTVIFVIGRVIRGMISGEAEKIILTEMPEPQNLLNLCEGIKVSRYRFDLEKEEHLYYILIDFMRSPEILKILTKSSLNKLKERKKLKAAAT